MNNLYHRGQRFLEDLAEERKIPIQMAGWYTAFDLREIKTSQLSPLTGKLNRIDIEVYKRLKDTQLEISFADMLSEFRRHSMQLQTLLFTLGGADDRHGVLLHHDELAAGAGEAAFATSRCCAAAERARGNYSCCSCWKGCCSASWR